MKNYLPACLFSAILGAAVSTWLAGGTTEPPVTAQDRLRSQSGASSLHLNDPRLSRLTAEERVNVAIYDAANRSVVNITTKLWSAERFFLMNEPGDGAGSGSVLDKEGHILTNDHVIENATEVRVTLFNGETYDAGLVGRDAVNDIAVLRIDAPRESLAPVPLGESSGLMVGQKVFAIGNPFGLSRTMTVGILSSLNRTLPSRTGRDMKSILQIDAALNSGNSGGPLLDSRGELIGMNTAILNPSGSGENTGVGFAIPVNTIRRVVPQLIEHGRVIRPVIGIASVHETEQGLVVIEVLPGGPAEKAGIRGYRVVKERQRRGAFIYERTYIDRDHADLVTAIDGRAVTTGDELLDYVESKRPGDQVVVAIVRDGRRQEIQITLGDSEG